MGCQFSKPEKRVGWRKGKGLGSEMGIDLSLIGNHAERCDVLSAGDECRTRGGNDNN